MKLFAEEEEKLKPGVKRFSKQLYEDINLHSMRASTYRRKCKVIARKAGDALYPGLEPFLPLNTSLGETGQPVLDWSSIGPCVH